jgi:hypothetical protein
VTEEIANRAYDVLVEECGATDDFRDEFVIYLMDGSDDHQCCFQGSLGAGGKFYHNGAGAYVTCFREDKTPERARMIARANEILSAVVTPYL